MTLHLVTGDRADSALRLCVQALGPEDTLVLAGPSAMALAEGFQGSCRLRLLPDPGTDTEGYSPEQLLDYGALVELCARHDRVICW